MYFQYVYLQRVFVKESMKDSEIRFRICRLDFCLSIIQEERAIYLSLTLRKPASSVLFVFSMAK